MKTQIKNNQIFMKMQTKIIKFMKMPLTLYLCLLSIFSFGQYPNITSSEIQYWVGSGSNEAILAIAFADDPENAYAWGYRWEEGTPTLKNLLEELNSADPRLTIEGIPGNYITRFAFQDDEESIYLDNGEFQGCWWMNSHTSINAVNLTDGIKIGWWTTCLDWSNPFGTINIIPVNDPNPPVENTYTIHAGFGDEWAMQLYGTISPVGDSTVTEGSSITYFFTPNAGYHVGSVTLGGVEKIQDVVNNSYTVSDIMQNDTLWVLFAVDKNNTITTNDILYWIGEGENEVIFAVNWCEPEIAFAWGYRFNMDKVLVSKVMDDIKAIDSRFDYSNSGGFITEISYNDNNYNLALTGDYWLYNVNEEFANAINAQYVYHNDIIEFGDESCGLSDDFWNNVWTTTITPVSIPSTSNITTFQQPRINASIYPNPTNDYTYLSISGIEGNISMKIVDVNGKLMQTEQFDVTPNMVKPISTTSFAKGIYFIHLQNNNTTNTQKLIVY